MMTPEDVARIEAGMFCLSAEDEAEIASIETLAASITESGIIQGFDPLRYEDADPFSNQNIPEGK